MVVMARSDRMDAGDCVAVVATPVVMLVCFYNGGCCPDKTSSLTTS
jgi:hypothetical protein